MNAEGKKKMTVAAAQLLRVQKSFEENGRGGGSDTELQKECKMKKWN